MKEQIVLVVRFRVKAAARELLKEKLKEVFAQIRHEDAFVNATLQEDIDDPEQLLVYETWRETKESFIQNQLIKPYRAAFEKAIADLEVDRTPQWLALVAAWD